MRQWVSFIYTFTHPLLTDHPSVPNWLKYAKMFVDAMYDPNNEVDLKPMWLR